ncbi:MAG: hypothetical protein LUC06_01140, partial [Oscillospiraceae bacterium]|nr:hypothetical protein [Oscillospiraceae bacterium]
MQGRTSTDYLSANGSTQSSLIPNYYTKNEEKSNDTMTYYVHNADGNYISSMLEKIQTSAEPLVICMTGVGHAVVARTDKAPVETEDGWWRVYIYDPNN